MTLLRYESVQTLRLVIHGIGIFTYIEWLNFMVNVGKYTIYHTWMTKLKGVI